MHYSQRAVHWGTRATFADLILPRIDVPVRLKLPPPVAAILFAKHGPAHDAPIVQLDVQMLLATKDAPKRAVQLRVRAIVKRGLSCELMSAAP